MNSIEITLTTTLTREESHLLARYIREEYRFSSQEWLRIRRIIGLLSRSKVIFQDQQLTFKQFYERMIDRRYAYPFLDQLYNLTDVMQEGQPLWAATAREIVRWFRQVGCHHAQTKYAGYLVAYCLYWWSAFARGYIFELTVFRKLEGTGIDFKPHDPRLLSERYAKYDLVVDKWKGDVKLSFYFLSETKAPPLDFYITRVYDRRQRTYQLVVLMKMSDWELIDGYTLPSDLASALSVLSHAIHLRLGQKLWVFRWTTKPVSLFEDWTQRIKTWQGAK